MESISKNIVSTSTLLVWEKVDPIEYSLCNTRWITDPGLKGLKEDSGLGISNGLGLFFQTKK